MPSSETQHAHKKESLNTKLLSVLRLATINFFSTKAKFMTMENRKLVITTVFKEQGRKGTSKEIESG